VVVVVVEFRLPNAPLDHSLANWLLFLRDWFALKVVIVEAHREEAITVARYHDNTS
jgi:hypothetical protein